MNIVCAICSELLIPSDEIFHTPCGHIFHITCLETWLDRSNTCPQCRERTTRRTIHRIYFNFSNNDSIIADPVSLQCSVDSLTFKLTVKDQLIKDLTESKNMLQKEADGLRQEVKHTEKTLNSQNSAIHALKGQIQFYKDQYIDAENKLSELELLKKDVQKLKNIQTLIQASESEAAEIMRVACYEYDPSTIMTYVAVMKREMTDSFNKRRELRKEIRNLQQELTKATTECKVLLQERKKRKELEEILTKQENERIALQAKLLEMQISGCNRICNKTCTEKEKYPEECKEHNLKEPSTGTIEEIINLDQTPVIKDDVNDTNKEPINAENTPQNIKSQGFFSMTNRTIKRNNVASKIPSILAKKSKFSQPEQGVIGSGMTFDGFGGHAKYDKFPKPLQGLSVKKFKEETKVKKQRLDTGDNQKLSDLLLR